MIRTNYDPPYTIEQLCSIQEREELEQACLIWQNWERRTLLRLGKDRALELWMPKKLRESCLFSHIAYHYFVDESLFETSSSLHFRFIDRIAAYLWWEKVLDPFDPDADEYVFNAYNKDVIRVSELPQAIERYIDDLSVDFNRYWSEHVIAGCPTAGTAWIYPRRCWLDERIVINSPSAQKL